MNRYYENHHITYIQECIDSRTNNIIDPIIQTVLFDQLRANDSIRILKNIVYLAHCNVEKELGNIVENHE